MKKMLTFCAMIVGAFSLLVGTSSCNKDNEECCEWTDDYNVDYKYCEDDDEVDAVGGWNLVKAAAAYYNGDCD
jgi:hypothetical protein